MVIFKMCILLLFSLVLSAACNISSQRVNNDLMLITDTEILMTSLNKVLDFVNRYYYEMNIDAALGIALTEAQLQEALKSRISNEVTRKLWVLLEKCKIYKKIVELLPKDSQANILFMRLLNAQLWQRNVSFTQKHLDDLGIYEYWSAKDLLKSRTAEYAGVSSDECLVEILHNAPSDLHPHLCHVSSRCKMLMFGKRIDIGYVMTHRLLYLQILRMINCTMHQTFVANMIRSYCSLILKEARTNAFLGFPQHDIFLEQVVLCGMEGYAEFLQEDWKTSIVQWQTVEGCYQENQTYARSNANTVDQRSANVIDFGCTDHATGVGAAALAVNLRYSIVKVRN